MGLFSSKSPGFHSREDWGAQEPRQTQVFHFPLMSVLVTSVGSYASSPIRYKFQCVRFLKELQNSDMFDKGFPDIAYNFYVGVDGSLYEGRGWYHKPSLTATENPTGEEAFAIAYMKPNMAEEPNDAMISTARDVIVKAIEMKWIVENCFIKGLTKGILPEDLTLT